MRVRLAKARSILGVAVFALALGIITAGAAQAGPAKAAASTASMQGLDDQVQEIKSDVLSIANELRQLEEKLLYPSDTQVAVFVALEDAESVELDSVRIHIDGEPVAHHIYSFKELDALRRGGVQRLYTGNLPTGAHNIEVSMAGKLSGGSSFEKSESFPFDKEVEPKVVGLTLAGKTVGGPEIKVGGW